jgi:hypothetical protein
MRNDKKWTYHPRAMSVKRDYRKERCKRPFAACVKRGRPSQYGTVEKAFPTIMMAIA